MIRKIIQIDEDKCIGCGLCANACQQGAIEMVGGKAKIVHDDYCDGIGNCLPVCPVSAITFSDKEVIKTKEPARGCPGTQSKAIIRQEDAPAVKIENGVSELNQWPVQIKLVPSQATYFEHANLLVAADCTAFAYGNFHSQFMKNRITLIGCPKLDEGDYTEKLAQIISSNNLNSVTVIRMEVPCCGGIENAVKNALIASKKMIPWQVITISTDGTICK